MKLKVLGSSSKGNCYLLQGEKETLIIECGVKWNHVKKALDFNIGSVCGCIITHEHKDHCKYALDVINAGVDIFLTEGTNEALNLTGHRVNCIKPMHPFKVGGFRVFPFDTKHDCNEPVGFLIQHPEMGIMLFATDTYYIEYKFEDLNHILIECNYSLDILNDNIEKGIIHPRFKERVLQSHFELENVKGFFMANDISKVKNIVLLHLSNDNSHSSRFREEIAATTKKDVYIAERDLMIDVSLYPF